MPATLSYANVFAADHVALSGFYAALFGFPEIEAMRSPIYRGLDAGGAGLGFNAHDAYALLNLADRADTQGARAMLTFDVDSTAEVERLVPVAVGLGATLIKPPYRTYYEWFQAVLLDPEQNVFRINHVLP